MGYTKYMAIGLFRLLELGKATDPESLKAMVEALNLDLEKVQTDLLTYKNILSKMAKGKELMEEVLQRERKKTAERLVEGQGRGRGRRGRRPGGRERLSLCPLPRLENTPSTHAPHDAPRTAARAAAPRTAGQIFPARCCILDTHSKQWTILGQPGTCPAPSEELGKKKKKKKKKKKS